MRRIRQKPAGEADEGEKRQSQENEGPAADVLEAVIRAVRGLMADEKQGIRRAAHGAFPEGAVFVIFHPGVDTLVRMLHFPEGTRIGQIRKEAPEPAVSVLEDGGAVGPAEQHVVLLGVEDLNEPAVAGGVLDLRLVRFPVKDGVIEDLFGAAVLVAAFNVYVVAALDKDKEAGNGSA